MNTCSIFFDLCGGCLISYRLWRSTLWSWKLPRCQSLIFSLQSYVVPFESYRSLIKVKYDLILMSLNMLSVLRFPSVHWLLFLSHLSSWDRRVLLKPRKRYILVFIGRPLSPTELVFPKTTHGISLSFPYLLSGEESPAAEIRWMASRYHHSSLPRKWIANWLLIVYTSPDSPRWPAFIDWENKLKAR